MVIRAPWRRAALAVFCAAWGGNEFTPLLVMYREREHFASVTLDLLLAAYVVGIVPGLLIGGPMSDRFGRRPLMLPAPIIAGLGSIILAVGASSPTLLAVGRVLSGVALGLAMAVGTSWIKELSSPPFDAPRTDNPGVRRGAMSLTAGFALGAAVAAALAQFAPLPDQLPYVVSITLSVVSTIWLWKVPETRQRPAHQGRLLDDLRVPSAVHRRFLFVVAPTAPWIFGCAASAYAVLPAILGSRVPALAVGFAGLMCLVGLTAGIGVQAMGARFDSPTSSRGVAIAIAVVIPGMLLAALTTVTDSVSLGLVASAVLCLGYGLLLVGGLNEVQRIAGPDDLAGLTAVFSSISYLGFFIPAVLAVVAPFIGYATLFLVGAVLATATLVIVLVGWRRNLPEPLAE